MKHKPLSRIPRFEVMLLKRGLALALMCSVFVAVPAVISESPAGALSCGTSESWFAGTSPTPQTNYYATTQLTTQPVLSLCTTETDSWSLAWVMIADNAGDGWTQSGYVWRPAYSTSYLFAQYSKNGSSWYTAFYNSAPSTAQYYVEYDFTNADMFMVAHAVTLLTTPWDPDTEWTTPWLPEWEGEVNYSNNDVPGSQSATANFSSMGIKTSRGGSVVNPSGLSLDMSTSNFGAAWDTSQSAFHIWSKS